MKNLDTLKLQNYRGLLLKLLLFVSIVLLSCAKNIPSRDGDEAGLSTMKTKTYKLPSNISANEFRTTQTEEMVFEKDGFRYTQRMLTDGSSGIYKITQKINGTEIEDKYRSTIALVTMKNIKTHFSRDYIVVKLWRTEIPDLTSECLEDIKSNSITIICNLDGQIVSSFQSINDGYFLFPITGTFSGKSYIEYSVSSTTDSDLPLKLTSKAYSTSFCCNCDKSVRIDNYGFCTICGSYAIGEADIEFQMMYFYIVVNEALAQFRVAIDNGIAKSECKNPNYDEIIDIAIGLIPSSSGLQDLIWKSSRFTAVISPEDSYTLLRFHREDFLFCKYSAAYFCPELEDITMNIANDLHYSHYKEGGGDDGGGNPGGGDSGGGGTINLPDYTKSPTTPEKPFDKDCFCVRGTPGQGVKGGLYGAKREGNRIHQGVDLGVNKGVPVYAIYSGTVTKLVTEQPDRMPKDSENYNDLGYPLSYKGDRDGGGNRVRIYSEINGTNFETTYMHLDKGNLGNLSYGKRVNAGDIIGYTGISGNSYPNSPVLHIQMNKNKDYNAHFDPIIFLPFINKSGTCGSPNCVNK